MHYSTETQIFKPYHEVHQGIYVPEPVLPENTARLLNEYWSKHKQYFFRRTNDVLQDVTSGFIDEPGIRDILIETINEMYMLFYSEDTEDSTTVPGVSTQMIIDYLAYQIYIAHGTNEIYSISDMNDVRAKLYVSAYVYPITVCDMHYECIIYTIEVDILDRCAKDRKFVYVCSLQDNALVEKCIEINSLLVYAYKHTFANSINVIDYNPKRYIKKEK